jgi:serine/threonine protein kinase
MIIDKRKLKSPIASGGEAEIYYCPNEKDNVLKIYHDSVNLPTKEWLVGKLIPIQFPDNIIKPLEAVYSTTGKFVGFKMKMVHNADPIHQFTKNKFCQLKGLRTLHLLKLLHEIGTYLERLHKNNFIIGDLNSHNVLVQNLKPYFIDIDSYGFEKVSPTTYTELFTPPECYKGSQVILNKESDYFAYNTIVWNVLTKLHPYAGTYEKDPALSTVDRLKRKLSVLGTHKIIIPKIIQSWKWMSPELIEAFKNCFEQDKRISVTPLLEEMLNSHKTCLTHDIYSSKYSKCPLCAGQTIIAAMTVTLSSGQFLIKTLFTAGQNEIIIDFEKYLTKDFIVHIDTGKQIPRSLDYKVEFNKTGDISYFIYEDKISTSTGITDMERLFNSHYQVVDNVLYYIDQDAMLTQFSITKYGNARKALFPTKNALFSVGHKGDLFIVQRYNDYSLIFINGTTVEKFKPVGKTDDWFIHQDSITNNWIFLYKLPSGKFRTILCDQTEILIDTDTINYETDRLQNLWFINNTVYDTGDSEIIAINPIKNVTKKFPCIAVNQSSRLRMVNGWFEVITDSKIHKVEVNK